MQKLYPRMRQLAPLALFVAIGAATTIVACNGSNNNDGAPDEAAVTSALQAQVKNIVVIYAENRSFDNLYGTFPGANGIPGVNSTATGSYVVQTDRDAASTVLASLPAVWGGLTAAGQYPVVTQADTTNKVSNKPFMIDQTYPVDESVVTRDLYHRFYENQMQIGSTGARDNSKFVAYADAGGLVMGYYDGSRMSLWSLAQDYVLADNFFQGAFGGSFLNHQYLICACAPQYPNADTAPAKPTITVLDTDASGAYLPTLTINATTSPASALDGPPTFVTSGNIAPKDYFGSGDGFRAVNTMQPPYQPSSNAPASDDTTKLYADTSKPNTLPPQTQTNIGDLLTAKSVSWAWYAGSWDATLATATTDRAAISANPPNFQFHHQPFNYYAEFDPATHAADRDAHLKDYKDLVTDAAAGTLPSVTFYKPQGNQNQHPGYANVADGDAHIADLVQRLQASPQWANMVIVITYDENGGFWDHVPVPKGDLLGPGTRIPALIISPLAKKGTVDHTQYDTASILRLITRRFALDALPGLAARDAALVAGGGKAMGDLTPALDLK
ncbi:MAG: acid phosphatase [Hydrocarboniphaga sp.]|uniref:acid phosphatase n=1 Tax=Hydrocarboniphaga sp. TaxID=2033016 RepID=UPI0026115A6A|nr:acid phosphatase [Hydrocarboniphaga sp.]MDB5972872.1 acid phosphatase [Hydrocarboniphaga sp.]